jgi:predicted O-methyltransferase YrrM
MTQAQWTAVDDCFADLLLPADDALNAALAASDAAGLPQIAVSPLQGRLLNLLARFGRAQRILEVGTLGGYSAIWLACALPPEGRLVTLELEPKHAAVARANLARAGLAAVAQVRVGPALDSLAALEREGAAPFDLIFIDADKTGYPNYWSWALKLARVGTLIVADNVVRKGAVADAASTDANVQGVQRYLELVAAEPRVQATGLQTVGVKGYDGFCVALVVA